MMTHPDLLAITAQTHIRDLAEDASKHRLAATLRRGRRRRWPGSHR